MSNSPFNLTPFSSSVPLIHTIATHPPTAAVWYLVHQMSASESFKFLANSPYIRDLATLVVSYGISINLVEVTWKSKLKAAFPGTWCACFVCSQLSRFHWLVFWSWMSCGCPPLPQQCHSVCRTSTVLTRPSCPRSTDPNAYSAFMGNFSTGTGIVTLCLMLLGRVIFNRFGWGVAALITPVRTTIADYI